MADGDTGYFAGPLPRVLAHRGLALDAPENTLLAFLKARAVGVTHLETDVHASSDGIAVVSHDEDLQRVLGRADRIDSLRLAELQKIDLGYGQTFCSLAEALDAFPDARFNVDLKSEASVLPAARAIRAAGAINRVLVTSFSDRRRRAAVRLLPGVATSASAASFATALAAARLGLAPVARLALQRVQAVQIPERFRGIQIITPSTIRALHAAAVEVHVWTINDPLDMVRLLDFGVDGLVTDRSDLALEVIRNRDQDRE